MAEAKRTPIAAKRGTGCATRAAIGSKYDDEDDVSAMSPSEAYGGPGGHESKGEADSPAIGAPTGGADDGEIIMSQQDVDVLQALNSLLPGGVPAMRLGLVNPIADTALEIHDEEGDVGSPDAKHADSPARRRARRSGDGEHGGGAVSPAPEVDEEEELPSEADGYGDDALRSPVAEAVPEVDE